MQHPPEPRRRWAIAVAVVALLFAACGGGSGSGGGGGGGDLKAKLLSLRDMPTGYSIDTSESEVDQSGPGKFCKELGAVQETHKAAEKVDVGFQKGDLSIAGGAFLGENIGRYPSARSAKEAFDAFADAVGKCTAFDTKDADGSTFKGTFASMSFSKVGDDTFASRLSGEAGSADLSLPVAGSIVVVREGSVTMLVVALGIGAVTIQPTEVEQIVIKGHSKL